MGLVFGWIRRISRSQQVARVADEIATRCQDALRERVWALGTMMSPAEARGYVRVHARNLVRPQVDSVLRRHAALARRHQQITELTVGRLVEHVVADLKVIPAQPDAWRRVA